MSLRPQVVVIGAGFGGLSTAKELKHAPVDVTIVDQQNFHTFQPLLYQVATSGLNAADIAHPVRGIFHSQDNVRFRQASVTGVDWDSRRLIVDRGEPLPFDHLVVAAGATTKFFGVPGAAEHGFPLRALGEAVDLRNHVLARFEAADTDPTLIDDGALTFVIAGGGSSGVELAGSMAELFDRVLRRDFPSLDMSRARVVLVEMQDHLLDPFVADLRRHAHDQLRRRGVEVRLGVRVASVSATRVCFADGEELPAHTVVWTAGIQPSPLVEVLRLPSGSGGRITVGDDLRVVGRPEAFAVGDIAAVHDRRGRTVLPQLAPVAIQGGRHVGRQIVRLTQGRSTRPFRYFDKGTMSTIGRSAAVAELPLGIKLKGTLAWFAWLGLHLVFLVGARNRVSVLLNWGWNYFTWDRGPRLILGGGDVSEVTSADP